MIFSYRKQEHEIDPNKWYFLWRWSHQYAQGITGVNRGLIVNLCPFDKKSEATKLAREQMKEFMRGYPKKFVSKDYWEVGKATVFHKTVKGKDLQSTFDEFSGKPFYPTVRIEDVPSAVA